MGFLLFFALMAVAGAIGAPVIYDEPIWLAGGHLATDLTNSYYQTVMSGIAIVGMYYALQLLQALWLASMESDTKHYFSAASEKTNKKGDFEPCTQVSTP